MTTQQNTQIEETEPVRTDEHGRNVNDARILESLIRGKRMRFEESRTITGDSHSVRVVSRYSINNNAGHKRRHLMPDHDAIDRYTCSCGDSEQAYSRDDLLNMARTHVATGKTAAEQKDEDAQERRREWERRREDTGGGAQTRDPQPTS